MYSLIFPYQCCALMTKLLYYYNTFDTLVMLYYYSYANKVHCCWYWERNQLESDWDIVRYK